MTFASRRGLAVLSQGEQCGFCRVSGGMNAVERDARSPICSFKTSADFPRFQTRLLCSSNKACLHAKEGFFTCKRSLV